MATKLMLTNPANGLTKKGYFGFSWTYLFFGWWVPLFRGEISTAILHLVITLFTCGIWQIIFSFFYNKQFMTRALENGYVLNDNEPLMAKARYSLGIANAQPVSKKCPSCGEDVRLTAKLCKHCKSEIAQ